MDNSEEDTLPDDVWKDSFDKLLDQRPYLRELNVIKRDVRASFNMNSSFENSSYNSSRLSKLVCDPETAKHSIPPNNGLVQYLDVPRSIREKKGNKKIQSKVVSTPIKRTTSNPFKCTLSPIGLWDLQHFSNKKKSRNVNEVPRIEFNATPINDNIVNVEYVDDSIPANMKINSSGASPLALVKQKWKSKTKKNVCFADDNYISEKNATTINIDEENSYTYKICPKLDLQPGKWQRSVNYYRRTINCLPENALDPESLIDDPRNDTIIIERPKSFVPTISVAGNRKSICIRPKSNQARTSLRSTYSLECNDFKRQILQRCGQRRILNFHSAYNENYLKNCCKIGEGAFGEVFVYTNADDSNAQKTVLKVIPIEGKELINGEQQKTYEQILPEIIISMELSGLSEDNSRPNATSGFVNLQRARCVKGQYPAHLQKLWEEYDLKKESENDHPKCFTSNQQYIVLELAFGGQDIEAFSFKSAEQSFSALKQIIITLAVGEREYQFEHRDLHWGNVLVLNTDQQDVTYRLDGETLTVPTQGIIITIIDYTLSRMTFNDYCFFNDLSNDEELFSATGDYQFDIYRIMRDLTNDKWDVFEPKTNLYWISYIITKFIKGVKYQTTRTKSHLLYLDKLRELQTIVLDYKSCAECAREILSF